MYDRSDLEACEQTANDIINSHSTTIADPPPPSFNNLVPVSNLLSLIHLPGVASLQISTPGCRPSWTGSTWPKLKIMLKWLSLKMLSLLLNKDLSTTSLTGSPQGQTDRRVRKHRYFWERRQSNLQPPPSLRVSPGGRWRRMIYTLEKKTQRSGWTCGWDLA